MLNREDARKTRCCGPYPAGRKATGDERYCVAAECAAWRWRGLDTFSAPVIAAVQKAAEDIGDKSNGKGKALLHVARNPGAYGLEHPTVGWCGLASKPE